MALTQFLNSPTPLPSKWYTSLQLLQLVGVVAWLEASLLSLVAATSSLYLRFISHRNLFLLYTPINQIMSKCVTGLMQIYEYKYYARSPLSFSPFSFSPL